MSSKVSKIYEKEKANGTLQSELEASKATISDLKKQLDLSKQAPDLKAVNERLLAENNAHKQRVKVSVVF